MLRAESSNFRIQNTPTTLKDIAIFEYFQYDKAAFALGYSEDFKIKIKQLHNKPGLYVAIRQKTNESLFSIFKQIKKFTYIKEVIVSNDTALDDIENDNNIYYLYKLFTETFADSKNLFYSLNHANINYYIKIPLVWTIESFLIFEHYINDDQFHKYSCFFENKKNELKPFKTNIISFDIETVSPNSSRVPDGTAFSDVLFSISIIDNDNKIVYAMVNIPVIDLNEKKYEYLEKLKVELDDFKVDLQIFDNERDMLVSIFTLFESFGHSIILGHNSVAYDMPFLKNRAIYYNLHGKFKYVNGVFTYMNLIHLDIFHYYKKFYPKSFPSYKLNTIANQILQASKYDLDAVNIRYVYSNLIGKDITYIDQVQIFDNQEYTVKKILDYNNIDTYLVLRLYYEISNSLQTFTTVLNVNTTRIVECKINEFFQTKIIKEALIYNTFPALSHDKNYSIGSWGILAFNNRDLVSRSINGKTTFAGGMNYIPNAGIFKNVRVCDYVSFYPFLMGNNISHETVQILTVDFVLTLNRPNLKYFMFVDHRGINSNDHIIQTRKYMNGVKDPGGFITFDEIKYRRENEIFKGDEKIVIFSEKIGLITKIIKSQNNQRSTIKILSKQLSSHKADIEDAARFVKSKSDEDTETWSGEEGDENEDEDEDEIEDQAMINVILNQDKVVASLDNLYTLDIKLLPKSLLFKLQIEQFDIYLKLVNIEYKRIQAFYQFLKIENSSIYGIVGSFSALKGAHVAAITTTLGRYSSVETVQAAADKESKAVFADTDSAYVTESKICNIAEELPNIMKGVNEYLDLGVKIYDSMYIIAKKTYLFCKDGEGSSRGIMKTGCPIALAFLQQIAQEYLTSYDDIIVEDLYQIFYDIFDLSYKQLKDDISLAFYRQNVKDLSEYKKDTAVTAMMRRDLKNNPTYKHDSYVSFVYLNGIQPTEVFLGNIMYTYKYTEINMLKTFQKPLTVLQNLLSFKIKYSLFKKYGVMFDVPRRIIAQIIITAFLDVRNKLYKEHGIEIPKKVATKRKLENQTEITKFFDFD